LARVIEESDEVEYNFEPDDNHAEYEDIDLFVPIQPPKNTAQIGLVSIRHAFIGIAGQITESQELNARKQSINPAQHSPPVQPPAQSMPTDQPPAQPTPLIQPPAQPAIILLETPTPSESAPAVGHSQNENSVVMVTVCPQAEPHLQTPQEAQLPSSVQRVSKHRKEQEQKVNNRVNRKVR